MPDARSETLVAYLDSNLPERGNTNCIDFALMYLRERRYTSAIPEFIKFLDFKSPRHRVIHILGLEDFYPAMWGLEEIGEDASPEVLSAIELPETTPEARVNAVAVWIALSRDHPGMRRLYLDSAAAMVNDSEVQRRLRWASSIMENCAGQTYHRERCHVALGCPLPADVQNSVLCR
jgi:hypothetical protein